MPMDRKRYPNDWDAISKRIRARADGRCECRGECGHDHGNDQNPQENLEPGTRCPALQGRPNPVTGRTVILTVAHLDHTPANCDPANLRAMCQRCHLSYDRERHQANARSTRRNRKATGDLFDPGL